MESEKEKQPRWMYVFEQFLFGDRKIWFEILLQNACYFLSNLFYFDFFLILFNIFEKVFVCVCVRVWACRENEHSVDRQSGRKGNNDTPDENLSSKNRENVSNTLQGRKMRECVRRRQRVRKCQKTTLVQKMWNELFCRRQWRRQWRQQRRRPRRFVCEACKDNGVRKLNVGNSHSNAVFFSCACVCFFLFVFVFGCVCVCL